MNYDMTIVHFVSYKPKEGEEGFYTHHHEVALPTREHALVFAAFCYSGGVPEGYFGIDTGSEFYTSLTGAERAFVHAGQPTCGMPEEVK